MGREVELSETDIFSTRNYTRAVHGYVSTGILKSWSASSEKIYYYDMLCKLILGSIWSVFLLRLHSTSVVLCAE